MTGRGLLFASLALAGMVLAAVIYGIATTHSADDGEIELSLADVEDAGVLQIDRAVDVYVVYNDGDPVALSADAQHVGDAVVFCESSQLFESPAHGEKFDILGYYYAGPAARGLARFHTRLEGDQIFIDLERPIEGPQRGAGPPREPQGPFCIPT